MLGSGTLLRPLPKMTMTIAIFKMHYVLVLFGLMLIGLPGTRPILLNNNSPAVVTASASSSRNWRTPDARERNGAAIGSSSSSSASPATHGESMFGQTTSADTTADDATTTPGTTRTLQRMAGGHLHHPAYRKYEEIAQTRKNTRLSKVFFHKKDVYNTTTTVRPTTARTRVPPTSTQAAPASSSTDRVFVVTPMSAADAATADYSTGSDDGRDDNDDTGEDAADDDARLLSDDNRLDSIDWSDSDRLQLASAGAGPEKHKPPPKDDAKKTLADQVADGKYGLIQTELFAQPPRRPGIVSYAPNGEVPADTAANLGGLHDDDIWLAEDHLLVLSGGSLGGNREPNEPWAPIDDYEAPQRQVRLPEHPKVPPPFLVQLDDNGPVQFIGDHQQPLINPFTNQSLLLFPDDGPGFPQAGAHNTDQKDVFARPGPPGSVAPPPPAADGDLGYQYLPPLPPWLSDPNDNRSDDGSRPAYMLPPIMRLPFPAGNRTGEPALLDEDDPSLYYPPPYSFRYESNYTNPVPPGPLVPGIVLPPPPNFFTRETQAPHQAPVRTSTARPVVATRVYKPISQTTSTSTVPTNGRPSSTSTTSTVRPTTTTMTSSPATTSQRSSTSTAKPLPTQVRVRPLDVTRTIVRPVYQTSESPAHPSSTRTQLRKVAPNRAHPIESDKPDRHRNDPTTTTSSTTTTTGNPPAAHKTHPVYYEYFDVRNAPPATSTAGKQQRVKTTSSTSTTLRPITTSSPATVRYEPAVHTIKLKPQRKPASATTQLHPHKPAAAKRPPYNSYMPLQPFDYDRYVYITPKPEIIPNGISNDVFNFRDDDEPELVPLRKAPGRPIEAFSQEVDNIRQTLQFFRHAASTQKPPASTDAPVDFYAPTHISTTMPSNAKAKAVYEYSFEASSLAPLAPSALSDPVAKFIAPARYDATPFKPMVQYSAPLNAADDFQAMPARPRTPPATHSTILSSTSSSPAAESAAAAVEPSATPAAQQPLVQTLHSVYQALPPSRGHAARNYKDPGQPHQQRPNHFYYAPPPAVAAHHQRRPANVQYNNQANGEPQATPNWVTIEKQIFRQIHQQQQPQQQLQPATYNHPKEINVEIQPASAIDPYDRPPQRNNYYNYQQQQQLPYLQQPYFRQTIVSPDRRQHLPPPPQSAAQQQFVQQQQQQQFNRHQQQQQQQQFEYGVDLSNDTAINYINPRPPINPDAEFIDPYLLNVGNNAPQPIPQRIFNQQQQQELPFPPPLPTRPPGGHRLYPTPPTTQQLHSLAKDLLVNYKFPLPPSNYNAEYLPEERFRRYYSQPQQQQASKSQRLQSAPESGDNVIRYKLPGEPEANVYFYTPNRSQQQQPRNVGA